MLNDTPRVGQRAMGARQRVAEWHATKVSPFDFGDEAGQEASGEV